MKRRDLLASGAGAALTITGCATAQRPAGVPDGTRPRLIDVHSHVFNASDLPSERFIRVVFLEHYPKQAVSVMNIDDPDGMDQLMHLFTFLVGRTGAPSAFQEMKVLEAGSAEKKYALRLENDREMIRGIADYIKPGAAVADDGAPVRKDKILRALDRAAGPGGVAVAGGDEDDARLAKAQNAFRSLDLGTILRWFGLFTRYRYSLAEQLASDHENQKFPVDMLCPALVDYDNWLGQHLDAPDQTQVKGASSLVDQVGLMGRIARRKTGPVVHGYVPFDPLRQAAWDAGVYKAFDPLSLVRKALREDGFIGVKLYPPMGFRAMGNADKCQSYSQEKSETIKKLLALGPPDPSVADCKPPRPVPESPALGSRLDAAMTRLFDTVVAENGVIMAHTNYSNGANDGFSHRADPAYWLPVFKKWPTLHISLAHFGSFDAQSVAAPPGALNEEASWEWTLGRYLRDNPNAPVYADISYLVEIVGKPGSAQADYDRVVKAWVRQFDPDCRHLMFGTDWMMLGIDPAYAGYTERVYSYFSSIFNGDAAKLGRLFSGNAAAFLGLRTNDAVRARLLKFYDKYGMPRSRLPEFPNA